MGCGFQLFDGQISTIVITESQKLLKCTPFERKTKVAEKKYSLPGSQYVDAFCHIIASSLNSAKVVKLKFSVFSCEFNVQLFETRRSRFRVLWNRFSDIASSDGGGCVP